MATKLLRFSELRDHGVVFGRRQVDRLEEKEKFPKRVKLGYRRVAWVEAEIDAWVRERVDART